MPTMNPRITFTVSEETMKAIDEYRFSHRMKNQTQAILSLIDLGFKSLSGAQPVGESVTDDDKKVLNLYNNTEPVYQAVALKIMQDNQIKQKNRA